MAEPRGAAGAAAAQSNDASPERTVVAQTPNTSWQVIGTAVRMVTVVEGEPITAQEHGDTVGWLPCHRRKFGQALQQFQRDATSPHHLSTTVNDTATFNKGKTPQGQRRPGLRTSKRPRPRLPRDDIKVVIRPREGMNVARVSDATLRDSVLQAAGLEPAEATEDLLRVNHEQNILVVSTALLDRAERYARIEELKVGETSFSAKAYVTTPEDSVKGVIHNIPAYDSAEDIARSIVYSRNPTALHARRMGRTNSAIIAFSGNRVPYFVYYRGAEYRCYIHKKKHEVCSTCGKLGHRMDVCPYPDRSYCSACGLANPMDEHECVIQCALCGKDHPTGDKQCAQRYRTPFILKQRQWRKEQAARQSSQGRRRDRSASFPRLPDAWPPAGAASARDNSVPAQRRPRSKSKKSGPRHSSTVQHDRQSIRTPDGMSQVSWAATASLKGSSQGNTHQDPPQTSTGIAHAELASIRATLDQVLAENRQLKAEIAQLKRSTTTTSTPAMTPAVQVKHSSELTPSPPKRRAEDNTSRQQPIVHNDLQLLESKLEKKFDERFDKLANMVTTLAGALAKFKEAIGGKVTSLEYSLTRVPHSSPGPTRPPPYARTHAVKAATILSNEIEQNTARNDNDKT
ncbi:hypothetical protein HPB48_022223 [Haemaphysalis longicornis]|uniref:CCHC-type domain-containing protein n=1 Tax=Haemaphysalis longicornis TaxID=44386 RepID=A0A9J6FKU8_HAELO|nr:hypothetical protein HPB48_022223 [Haemaphysalis longicornis]